MTSEIISYIENRCNETLCLTSAELDKEVLDEVKTVTLSSAFVLIEDWNKKWKGNRDVIHMFKLSIRGKKDINVGGRTITLPGHYFTHAFNLIEDRNNTFIFCDSWEHMHYMNCRKRRFTYTELYEFLSTILRSIESGEIENKDIVDTFLNDDKATNWDTHYFDIVSQGYDAVRYSKDNITTLPDMYDLKLTLTIRTYIW
jgi:hypothetical protein